MHRYRYGITLASFLLVFALSFAAQAYEGNLLVNPTFEGAEEFIPPPGWQLYGSLANGHRISVIHPDDPEKRALLIEDLNQAISHEGEIGLQQAVQAGPGRYRAIFRVGPFDGTDPVGPFLQIRFFPSRVYEQIRVTASDTPGFVDYVVEGVAPEGTNEIRIYVYTPQKHIQSFQLQSIHLVRID